MKAACANTHPFVYRSAVPVAPAELFPASVEEVFNRLNSIGGNDEQFEPGEERPSTDNIEWAKRVLLRVLPRRFLIGAEIDAFHGEIHVTWERDNKRVVAFLPAPNELKLYLERTRTDGEVEHEMMSGRDPWVINPALGWLYNK